MSEASSPGDLTPELAPKEPEAPPPVAPPPVYPVDEYQRGHVPRRRRMVLPLVLFLLTTVTTFCAGALHWQPVLLTPDPQILGYILANWYDGLVFMLAVMAVLLAHEMGHFLMTLRYGVPASLPYFIPLPVMMIGTMGAVIGMDGSRADRKQMFDIGLAGPLAGLVIALPLVWLGVQQAEVDQDAIFGRPLLVQLLIDWLRPDIPAGVPLRPNALYMAGWVGLLITGLNMLPISQLDGGHVSYAVLGKYSRWLARGLLLAAFCFVIIEQYYSWTLMLVLVTFLGVDHPPTANDQAHLGRGRRAAGIASLAIPVLCFTPYPVLMG